MLISSYNPQEMGDVLVVITGPDTTDQTVSSKKNVTQITAAKDGRLLGYNFFNASEILPELKAERGQVFLSDEQVAKLNKALKEACLLYTSPSPRD